ncbi:PilT/PilU family type 4a pilus ATPase [Phormidium sp. FACHB-592]|uniref:PilT/PilU family type 4a pilus ATPase n=1 Tax=Stenomitos frigidus AS-A4 TaxID=2933935 RepID=A0ABV0KF74_9CYAN|nr:MULTISPECIES: PilT/PilU family type 4a pilus ATPase [Cyanophyceae]MBD2038964.1 PilT/PilU family type 4a pilus ATPase [Leptolyngbya sp. FACHB-321]MBD2076491.1 PilT/PilU family type 4a pilus ATPase [Phormidium sp. FACHB-592]
MTESQRPSSSPPPPPRVPPAPPPPMRTSANNGATVAATQQMTSAMPSGAATPTMISTPATSAATPTIMSSQATGLATPTIASPSAASQTVVSAPPAPPAGHRPTAPPPLPAQPHRPSNGSPTLAEIVRHAFDKGYSDVHAGVGEVPRYRNRGEIDATDWPVTDRATFYSWLREILSEEDIREFEETLDFDAATQYDFARVRINIFDSLHGPAMVLRLIPLKILTMEQLNLPPVFKDVCHYHKGLVLVTGPTGSGKSTTMAAMVDYINKEMPKHIITIEDPIEFVHKSQKALIKHREVGIHTRKFDNALKAALREDPDLILVGEMRDKETVNTALKAAQTGHLVMGTLHTNSAVKTIERILQLFEPEQQEPIRISLAESMVAVISQGLCRTTDGKRAAFHDILINTDAIKDFIRRGEIEEIEQIIPRCTFDGMCTMNQSLYKLYEAGRITEEVALEMSPKPNEMAQSLRGRV